ncbi:MAG: tripartite tricarboxylate transporter TctB family protein [Marinobacter sp.]|uniref:tripartite tricarboxylate transporter TctB family protein n=1 Tax=Marinobacter sp. TaxID=50741 RepID=UPI0034A057D8
MVQLNARTVFSFLVCAFAAVVLFQTLDLRSDAALVPRVIGVPLLFLAGFQFACDLFPALGTRLSFAGTDKGGLDNTPDNEGFGLKGNYPFVAWMVLFVLAIYFTGVIAGIVIAFLLYLKLLIKQSWMLSVLYSLLFALSVYLIFVQGMGVYYFTSPVG